MDLRETYNRIAHAWHQNHQNDDWWVAGTDYFTSLLAPNSLVLDAGCGGGVKSKYLITKGLRVVGIDFSDAMIAIAKREVPEGTFLVHDLRNVSNLPYRFDAVFLQATLLHVPKQEVPDTLRHTTAVLADGGYLYLAVKKRRPEGPDEEMLKEHDYGYPYERFFSYFSTDELLSYLQKAGLTVVHADTTPSGKTRWIQIIAKKKQP